MRRRRLELGLQVLLVLVASLLGIVTNYATNVEHVPLALEVLQRAAVPGIGVLIVLMVVGQVAAYRLERPAPPPRAWDPDRVPYPGLDAFTEDEAAVFFGRDTQIAEVLRRLHDSPSHPAGRFVGLVGASGSGKSSLAQAGVLPRLRERRWMVLPVLTPGVSPMAALAGALAGAGADQASVLRRLRQSPDALSRELDRLRQGSRFRRTLLLVDQLEETVTLASRPERDLFFEVLDRALARDSWLWVLATVRVEFLGSLLGTEHAELLQNPVAIGAIGRSQMLEAIQRPGKLVGLDFAPGLVEMIADEAGTSDALPLLAYLLQELYFSAGGSGATVTEELYRRLGGVAGALARQADQTVLELRAGQGIGEVLRVLLKFVTVEGHEATRRRVPLAELTAEERHVVDTFVDARLLVTGGGGQEAGGGAYAHVAHEALFRQWPPLRQEVEAGAERLRQRAELERWAADWEHAGRSGDYLLTGERLSLAQQWLAGLEEAGQATGAVRSLVDASRRRDLAFLRRVSEGVGRHVLANTEQYPELSILLSLAALGECVRTPVAQRALMAALAFSHLRTNLAGHTDTVRCVAWSPDGRRIATASRDGSARIFDAASGRSLAELVGAGIALPGT